jgi:Cu/Ag efflux pump CusA
LQLVQARLEGKDLGTAISEIKAQLAKDVKFPAGMTVEYGGLYQEQQARLRELALSLVLAVVLVFITLLIEFRSFAHPVSIVAGAELLQPLAIAVIGGLAVALLLSLVVTPTVYAMLRREPSR